MLLRQFSLFFPHDTTCQCSLLYAPHKDHDQNMEQNKCYRSCDRRASSALGNTSGSANDKVRRHRRAGHNGQTARHTREQNRTRHRRGPIRWVYATGRIRHDHRSPFVYTRATTAETTRSRYKIAADRCMKTTSSIEYERGEQSPLSQCYRHLPLRCLVATVWPEAKEQRIKPGLSAPKTNVGRMGGTARVCARVLNKHANGVTPLSPARPPVLKSARDNEPNFAVLGGNRQATASCLMLLSARLAFPSPRVLMVYPVFMAADWRRFCFSVAICRLFVRSRMCVCSRIEHIAKHGKMFFFISRFRTMQGMTKFDRILDAASRRTAAKSEHRHEKICTTIYDGQILGAMPNCRRGVCKSIASYLILPVRPFESPALGLGLGLDLHDFHLSAPPPCPPPSLAFAPTRHVIPLPSPS